MRLAHPKLERITQWARLTDDIRALVVTGSLARDDGSSDTFSDLDLQVITWDLHRYTSAHNWLHNLGDVWIRYPLNTCGATTSCWTRILSYAICRHRRADFRRRLRQPPPP